MSSINTPNLILPLAASYNPRGMQGYTNTVTNALDQRKVNSIYEPVQNAITQKTTLYLTKRPGWNIASGVDFGTTGQVAYLVSNGAGLFGNGADQNWVFSVSGNDCRASSSAVTTVILSAANYFPAYVDKTSISGTDTLLVQLLNAGTEDQRVFFSSAIGTFTEISDSVFTGLIHAGKMENMDGYAFVADGATQRIYNSSLNTLATWPANNYITKQIQQDGLIGLAQLGKRIVAFGQQTAEVFGNAGNPTGSPLITIPELFAEIGCYGPRPSAGRTHYYTILNDRMYFIGVQGLGSFGLFSFDGAKFNKISRGPFNKIINEEAINNRIYSVNKVMFQGKSAVALQMTATTASTQRWLMYFPEWNDWFEWNSTVFTPVNSGRSHLGVGANQHELYIVEPSDSWQDAGVNYTFTHQFQLPKTGNNSKFMAMCQLVGDTSRSAQSINVEFSDDDGQTWQAARGIDMTTTSKALYRCGSYKERLVRLSYTGANEVRLQYFGAQIQ